MTNVEWLRTIPVGGDADRARQSSLGKATDIDAGLHDSFRKTDGGKRESLAAAETQSDL